MTTGLIKDENSNLNSKFKIRASHTYVQSDDELKQLWIACYFERRLSKPLVQAMDLKHTLRLLRELVNQGTIDLRAVVPLVLGLSKILYRKFNYLISESASTLETLKHPFGDLNDDDKHGGSASKDGKKSAAKRQQNKRPNADARRDQHFAHHARPKNFIDLSVVKYPGLDQSVIEQIQEALKKDYSEHLQGLGMKVEQQDSMMRDDIEVRGGMTGASAVKLEDEGNDIRYFYDKSANYSRDIGLMPQYESPVMNDELRGEAVGGYQGDMNITNDMINIANQMLNDYGGNLDNYPMLNMEEVPFLQNDDIDNFEMKNDTLNQEHGDMILGDLQDFMINGDGETPDKVADGNKGRKGIKRQVQYIRQQLLKVDKKIQRDQARQRKQQQNEDEVMMPPVEDDDDLIKNMSNLILKQSAAAKGLEDQYSMSNLWNEGSTHFTTPHIIRSSTYETKQSTKKQASSSHGLSLLNPQVESFLTFEEPQFADKLNKTKESMIDPFVNPNLDESNRFAVNDFVENLHNQPNDYFNFESSFQQDFNSFQSPHASKAKFTELTPQQLHKKDFQNELESYDSLVYKRSQQTYQNVKQMMQDQNTHQMTLNEIIKSMNVEASEKKETAMKTFIDMLFLNQNSTMRLTQLEPLHFGNIDVSLVK